MTVVGGVLVVGLGALVVAKGHKNRTQADHPAKIDSAVINIHNHSSTHNVTSADVTKFDAAREGHET